MNDALVKGLTAENRRLTSELSAARAELAQLKHVQAQLAEPSARRFVIGLEWWCEMAGNPANSHHAQAKQLLSVYARVHKAAMAAASGIVLPNGRPQ